MKRKKVIKNMVAVISALCLSCLTSCGNSAIRKATAPEGGMVAVADTGNAEIWSCGSTVNVLQDKSDYDDVKGGAKIEVMAAKGEYEATQLILTANKFISSYDLETVDLKTAGGEVLKADRAEIFHEKYIEVKMSFNKGPTGMYPDAIVPLEKIKKAGENYVKKGENQGIYIRYNIPLDQPAGVYTGTYKLKTDSVETDIPVRVEVADVTVSEVNHVKSVFIVYYGYYLGEQDGSQDMLDKYSDFLYEYRIDNGTTVVPEGYHRAEDIEHFVENSYEKMQNPKCSFVCIPYRVSNRVLDVDVTKKYLRAMAKKSFETDYNMFEKAGAYIGAIDEPDGKGIDDAVRQISGGWTSACNAVADEVAADSSITSPIKDEVVASIRACYNVVTSSSVERFKPLGVTTFVPGFTNYDTAEKRAEFEGQERWWYGCIYPRAPYVNFQIDNFSRSPLAVMGWQQADYDVVGNLFWSVDSYTTHSGETDGTETIKYLEDYYSTATRYPNTNGDGYLLYPGAPYGVDGPVASLRLESIRDGFEDYEILRELKEKYETVGASFGANSFDSSALFENFASSLYTGAVVTGGTTEYEAARKVLFELYTLNKSSAEFYLTKYEDDGAGTKTFGFYTSKDTTLKNGGVAVADKTETDSGVLWTLPITLDKINNVLDLEITHGDKTYNYSMALGGATVTKTARDIGNEITSDSGARFTLMENAEGLVDPYSLKMQLSATAKDVEQSVNISGDFISGITSDAKKANLKFIWLEEGDGTDPEVIISAKFKNSRVLVDIASGETLHWRVNVISVDLSNINWSKVGELEYIRIRFGGVDGESARTVYLNSMTVYKK